MESKANYPTRVPSLNTAVLAGKEPYPAIQAELMLEEAALLMTERELDAAEKGRPVSTSRLHE